MRIGEFARKNGVTVRALRHYEQMGLIAPDRVDGDTGYRYYRPQQGTHLRLVAALKQLGFSLGEIAEMLEQPIIREELLRILGDKLLNARRNMDLARMRRKGLEAVVAYVLEHPLSAHIDLKEVSAMIAQTIETNLPMEGRADMLYEAAWKRSEENSSPLSVLVFDVDHLLHINESYGREAGDEILDRIFNTAIRLSMDKGDHSFAERGSRQLAERKGGDEFVMTMEGMGAQEALSLAQSICEKIRAIDFAYAGCPEAVTVSGGAAGREFGARSVHELIHQAETAMMDAKTAGRGGAMIYRP